MVRRILFAFSVAALFVASHAYAKGPFGTIKVGNWTGGAWTNDATGAFSHCAAGAPYLSGIYFMVSLDVSCGWTVVANDAKDCKGKFASGRMSEVVDSDVIFRGFASCEDSDGARVAQYFIVPREKGGFVMFSVVANTKVDQARELTTDTRLTDFRKAAWTAVH